MLNLCYITFGWVYYQDGNSDSMITIKCPTMQVIHPCMLVAAASGAESTSINLLQFIFLLLVDRSILSISLSLPHTYNQTPWILCLTFKGLQHGLGATPHTRCSKSSWPASTMKNIKGEVMEYKILSLINSKYIRDLAVVSRKLKPWYLSLGSSFAVKMSRRFFHYKKTH